MRFLLASLALLVLFLSPPASARCYFFSNGGAIRVCIRGDTWELFLGGLLARLGVSVEL